jgi:hypothetical protein
MRNPTHNWQDLLLSPLSRRAALLPAICVVLTFALPQCALLAQAQSEAAYIDGIKGTIKIPAGATSVRATRINGTQLRQILSHGINELELIGDDLLKPQDYTLVEATQGLSKLTLTAPSVAPPTYFKNALSMKGLKYLEVRNPAPQCQAFADIEPARGSLSCLKIQGIACNGIDWADLPTAASDLEQFEFVGQIGTELFDNLKRFKGLKRLGLNNSNENAGHTLSQNEWKTEYEEAQLVGNFILPAVFASYLVKQTRLRSLDIRYVSIGQNGETFTLDKSSLEVLKMEGCKFVSDFALLPLIASPSLRELSMHPGRFRSTEREKPYYLSPRLILALARSCRYLRNLSAFIDQEVGKAHLEALFRVAPIERLHLSNCVCMDDRCMESITQCTSLTSLKLTHAQLASDSGFKKLSALSNLRELQLLHATNVGEASCAAFATLPMLTRLSISGSDVLNERAFKELCKLKLLTHLEISDCPKVNPENFSELTGMNQLVSLALREVGITSAQLQKLNGLSRLSNLDISGNREIDDTCIEALANFNALKVLTAYRTSLSAKGIDALRTKLPELTVVVSTD